MFCKKCGAENPEDAAYCTKCGAPLKESAASDMINQMSANVSAGRKDKLVAILLAFFLGGLGIQEFYLGRTGRGILGILFCWTGIPAIVALVQIIKMLLMNEQQFQEYASGK